MSDYERNKGRLVPAEETMEQLAERLVPDHQLSFYDSKVEALRDDPYFYVEKEGLEIIEGKRSTASQKWSGTRTAPYRSTRTTTTAARVGRKSLRRR